MRTNEEKEIITTAVATLLIDGYKEARELVSNIDKFDKLMAEISAEILDVQSKSSASFVSAGLLLLIPDEGDDQETKEDMKRYECFLKAAIVWYLFQNTPDLAEELGLHI